MLMRDFWVFGYGSLMWNPGFAELERRPAMLYGSHRALCVHSWVHRGTYETPGLVLGLDRGGSCRGIALKASGAERDRIISYLRNRELVTNVYFEDWRRVDIGRGEHVEALTYIVDRSHTQYAGRLDDEEIAKIVRRGVGRAGPNLDYVLNTLAHLREEGIYDPHLEAIGRILE
jgi:glutathione-specific gamma-glutamylcyclotransferase